MTSINWLRKALISNDSTMLALPSPLPDISHLDCAVDKLAIRVAENGARYIDDYFFVP